MKIELCVYARVRVNAPVYQLNLKCTCMSSSGSWNEGMGLPGAVANITLEMETFSNRGIYCIGENRPLENHSMKMQSFGNCFFPPHSKLEKKQKKTLEPLRSVMEASLVN